MSQTQEPNVNDTQENKTDDNNTNDVGKKAEMADQATDTLPQTDHKDNDADSNDDSDMEKGLDSRPPYTIKSVFTGLYCKNNMTDYRDKPNIKPLLLPFQDEKTWALLTKTLDNTTNKQPKIDKKRKPKQAPSELKYLSNLFQTLGQHKASKFINYLNRIRSLGTSSVSCPMDITQIGQNRNKLSRQQNGENMYQTFFNQTLPFIKTLILSMPQIFANQNEHENETKNNEEKEKTAPESIHFLNPTSNGQITLSRGQIASILACCWFGIELYEHCSFRAELNVVGTAGKLECWIRYFDFVRQQGMNSDWFNKQKVTVWRRYLTAKQCEILEYKNLVKNDTLLCAFTVSETGCIEDEVGALQADFANQYIGGGVLEGGNVQEEIRFTVNTECIISKWLCPLPMRHNESIIVFGSQQFFNYAGYGSSFCFNGYRNNEKEMFFCENKTDRLGSNVIVGIDALYLFAPRNQINIQYMMREIAKSYIGYSISNNEIGHEMNVVSTGNWGCGIFRGDPQLKAILQWISISLSNRCVAYYTFKDRRVANGELSEFIKEFSSKNITVGNLWKTLINPQFGQDYKHGMSVIDLLRAEYK